MVYHLAISHAMQSRGSGGIGRKLNLRLFDLNFATDDFRRFLGTTGLGSKSVKKKAFEHLSLHDNEIIVNAQVDSYDAAAVAQYLRSRFIKHGHNNSLLGGSICSGISGSICSGIVAQFAPEYSFVALKILIISDK